MAANHPDYLKLRTLFRRGSVDPDLIDQLGTYYLQIGEFEKARDTFRRALVLDSRNSAVTPLLFKLSICLLQLKNFRQAREALLSIAQHSQAVPEFHFNLGKAMEGLGDLEGAVTCIKRSVDLLPKNEQFWVEYLILRRLVTSDHSAVLQDIEGALAHHPSSTALLNLKAECLLRSEDFPSALGIAYSLPSGDAMSLYSRGVIFQECGYDTEAETSYRAALANNPSFANASMNLGLVKLSQSEFSEGWAHYTRRWHSNGFHSRPIFGYSGISFPREKLLEDCHVAREILVFAEQGLGEQLLFATCLPDLLRINPIVRLVLDERLNPLFSSRYSVRCEPFRQKCSAVAPKGTLVLAAGDLPFLFRNSLDEFPTPSAVTGAQSRSHSSDARGKLRVGICLGSSNPLFGRSKAVDPLVAQSFLTASEAYEFVNLDHTIEPNNFELLARSLSPGGSVDTTFNVKSNDFQLLTHQVKSCDLILCASCTVAHLAGHLGKKALVITTKAVRRKFWYWANNVSGRSLWYPSVRVEDKKTPSA